MIFISSSGIPAKTINEAITTLHSEGYVEIELSGGTSHYANLEKDLFEWQDKGLGFILHNYFPPPEEDFIINLASLDAPIEAASLAHVRKAIGLSERLDIKKYGVHAGFLINFSLSELGKSISTQALFDRQESLEKFCANISLLQSETDVELYIENNVVSPKNLANFNGHNPFFLTNYASWKEIYSYQPFNLLLDVAHLKVSCQALNLNFDDELGKLISLTDYIHVSDNDGFSDSNLPLSRESLLYQQLRQHDLSGKTITIEVYKGLEAIRETLESILSLV